VNKIDVVRKVLGSRFGSEPAKQSAQVFAPSNIALCKYWGKRNQELNLPITSSLSIGLGDKGATTEIKISNNAEDLIILNGTAIKNDSKFSKRLVEYLNLFRKNNDSYFEISIHSNIPIAAGMASSACGFAALANGLNEIFGWGLEETELSIFARLGSGSACRSIWQGFVEWHAGIHDDGMDCYAKPIATTWPELCIGLLILSEQDKGLSSREAMQRTIKTSSLYHVWPTKVSSDLSALKKAINLQDFNLLGKTAESNAITMHATMLGAWPPISYWLPETTQAMRKIWDLRAEGLPLYFTQDAGPNLKLLFLQQDADVVQQHFSKMEIVRPFV
jgi:diphosphomevalonate decarboxylase